MTRQVYNQPRFECVRHLGFWKWNRKSPAILATDSQPSPRGGAILLKSKPSYLLVLRSLLTTMLDFGRVPTCWDDIIRHVGFPKRWFSFAVFDFAGWLWDGWCIFNTLWWFDFIVTFCTRSTFEWRFEIFRRFFIIFSKIRHSDASTLRSRLVEWINLMLKPLLYWKLSLS